MGNKFFKCLSRYLQVKHYVQVLSHFTLVSVEKIVLLLLKVQNKHSRKWREKTEEGRRKGRGKKRWREGGKEGC